MFVLYDGLPMQTRNSRHRGIGRYASQLLGGLCKARPDWRIEVVEHDYLPPADAAGLHGVTVRRFRPPFPYRDDTRAANERYYADWLAAQRPDWLLLPSVIEAEGVIPVFDGPRPRQAAIAYDLIPLLFHRTYGKPTERDCLYSRLFRRMTGTDLLLAISAATAHDVLRMVPDEPPDVVNIRGASDPQFRPLPADQLAPLEASLRTRFGLDRPFILYVGGYDYRKNLVGSIAGYAALPAVVRDQVRFVVACQLSPDQRAELAGHADRLGVGRQVMLTGYVTDDELTALYQLCRVFFFPSLYEGMGLPVIEALQCGAPVVASANSSLPEFAGRVSWYCDPRSPASMAEALTRALAEPRDARLADRLEFAGQFCWSVSGEAAARALEGFRPKPVPAAPRKRRVAFVTPFPPAATGISDYAAEVADLLADRYELEVVLDPAQPTPPPALAGRFRLLTADEVAARHDARPFDLFVYQVGNSRFHTYMLPLLERHPGLVVLHDFYLGGLVAAAQQAGVWPGTLPDALDEDGDSTAAEFMRTGHLHPVLMEDVAPVSGTVLDRAAAVLVHSGLAWQRVRRACRAPVTVVPHVAFDPHLGGRAAERRRLGLDPAEFIVCSLGHYGRTKRIPSVVRAVAQLPPDVRRRTRLVLAGPIWEGDRRTLIELTTALGVADRVECRGRVPIEDFPAYAVAADACVQLRYPTRGETSGALLRAMAAGATCITSDGGTMAEVPNTVVLKVSSPRLDVPQLAAHLTALARDPDLRDRLGEAARRFAARYHGPDVVAAKYAAAIDHAIALTRAAHRPWLDAVTNALADAEGAVTPRLISSWAALRERALRAARGHPPEAVRGARPAAPRRAA